MKGEREEFAGFSQILDVLEDYHFFQQYIMSHPALSFTMGASLTRVDSDRMLPYRWRKHNDRTISATDAYNKLGTEKFILLLATRAGGLGIYLATTTLALTKS
jgi:SWI/SNF-related matrix-associated actin-dependent regulator of chromatin subfamily A member 5